MFDFALWDTRRRRLLIGRDRLGVKPLYVYQSERFFALATEAKALLALPGLKAELDRDALTDYLHLGYVPAPRSLFRGIRKLPPATLLAIEDGRVTEWRYWRLPSATDRGATEADWVDRVCRRMEESVRMQMISDVPIGAFLSGGIDSSAVVAFMARHSEAPIRTYSIGFEGGEAERLYNELPYARQVARLFNTEHHEIVVKPDVVGLLPRLLWHMDEPIADSAFITTYLVSAFAREEVKVILSGVGGDELFAGYRRYQGHYYNRFFRWLPPWARHLLSNAARRLPGDRHSRFQNVLRLAKGYLSALDLSPDERYRRYLEVFGRGAVREFMLDATTAPNDAMSEAMANAASDDELNRLFAIDAETQLPDDLLLLTDKMSMATSLECRVPLLDHELAILAASIPGQLKMKGGQLKYLMKAALSDILPRDILYREKRGFGTPMGAWLKSQLAPLLRHLLSREIVAQRGLFHPVQVAHLMANHAASRIDGTDALLALMNLEIWSRIYLDCRSQDDVAAELKSFL
jgi:asparagine synthase (glutamine-hydrolysing)